MIVALCWLPFVDIVFCSELCQSLTLNGVPPSTRTLVFMRIVHFLPLDSLLVLEGSNWFHFKYLVIAITLEAELLAAMIRYSIVSSTAHHLLGFICVVL